MNETAPTQQHETSVLKRIEHLQAGLTKAESSVARTILTQSHSILRKSLHEFAELAQVSEPTVVRFCRKLGYEGYREFKIVLAQDLIITETYGGVKIESSDGSTEIIHKVFNSTLERLVRARNAVQPDKIREAVGVMASARKIEFFALGSSGDIAIDAHHKFFRLGFTCIAYTDTGMQKISAKSLTAADVVVIISSTGEIQETIEVAQAVSASGAFIIGIAPQESRLAAGCHLVLNVELNSLADIYSPIMARIAHLLILDTLAVGVTLMGDDLDAQR